MPAHSSTNSPSHSGERHGTRGVAKVAGAAAEVLRRSLPKLIAGTRPGSAARSRAGLLFRPAAARGRPHRLARRARAVHDLVRAVAPPFPGAFTDVNGCGLRVLETRLDAQPARSAAKRPVSTRRTGAGTPIAATAGGSRSRAWRSGEMPGRASSAPPPGAHQPLPLGLKAQAERGIILKNVLILGVNGFIGHHLSKYILAHTDWHIYGMDLQSERVGTLLDDPRFHFVEGDITINQEWVEYHVRKCDVILPLVAIATPATYVREPLRVFELDFEANLPIIRHCVKYKKRVVFPSTSEVYGACRDKEFDPRPPKLVLGPIHKQRWIYSCVQAAAGPHHLGLRPAGPAVHPVPPLQLGRLGPRQHGRSEGGQLARADAVPRPHRARRADQAGRRRQPDPRLHLHRRCGRVPDQASSRIRAASPTARSTTSAIPHNLYRSASWRR